MIWVQLAIVALVLLGVYTWMSFALSAVFSKIGAHRDAAWIPIYRYVVATRASGLPTLPVWVARGVAIGGWLAFATVWALRAGGTLSPGAHLLGLAVVLLAVASTASLVAWVMWVLVAQRIEQRLVVERWLWWVAALVPPLWATLIGFGSSGPVVGGPVEGSVPEAEPEAEPEADDETRAIQRVSPAAVVAEASAQQVPAMALAGEEAMTTDDNDITGEIPRVFSPYDRPGAPAPASASTAVSPVDWGYEDDDSTFFAKRRRARWVLRVVGGEEYDLEDVTTIGREGIRPIPGVLPIMDDTRTVSKLHARLRRESDNWFITDLGSTNGTFVRNATGSELEVKAQSEAKVEGTLLLGDLELVIIDQRESA
jgi:hypothetical protein